MKLPEGIGPGMALNCPFCHAHQKVGTVLTTKKEVQKSGSHTDFESELAHIQA